MTEQEAKQLSHVGEGKAARLVMNHLAADLEAQRASTVAKLKIMYRAGDATEARLLAGLAELCTLDDLETRLRAKIRRGDHASKELDNAT